MTRSDIKDSNWEKVPDDVKTTPDIIKTLPKQHGGSVTSKKRIAYMQQPNVKAYNKVFYKRAITGRPYKWSSVEELQSKVVEYLELCDKTSTIPTVTALCTWLHCNRDTLYAHANNPNSPFSDVLKNYIDLCHTSLENGAIEGKVNSVVYIFMGKNYWNMSDSKEIKVSANSDTTITNSAETMDAIQKQLSEENTINANYNES